MAISRGIQRLWVIIKLKDNSLNQLGNGKIKSLIVPKTKKLAILILKSKNMKQIFKKEGIMKGVMLVCAILALFVSSPAQSQTLFDDFTGPLLDSSRWFGNRIVGENISNTLEFGQTIAKKKLDMFNHCLGSTADGDTSWRTCSTRLVMQDGADIIAMEALVQSIALEQTNCSANVDNTTSTWIRFGGAFFNSTPITGTVSDQTNDVQAYISLRRDVNSPEPAGVMNIEGYVFRCTNADCSQFNPVTTTGAPNPLPLGTINVKKKVQLRLAWDPTNHRFLFKQGKKNPEVEMVYVPRENFPPFQSNGGYKRLEIRHHLANCSAGATSGWARAYFDNFYITRD